MSFNFVFRASDSVCHSFDFVFEPGTSGRLRRMSLIWPVTYSFNITLALGYIVLGTGPDCKPAPVPGLLSEKKFLQSLDGVAWLLRRLELLRSIVNGSEAAYESRQCTSKSVKFVKTKGKATSNIE
jgi:hypothetical protein